MPNPLDAITRLKEELDTLRPLPSDVLAQIEQKLRLEANYNSNAIEGNTLTYGETRSLILHGLTAHGKPMRDHLDIQGHDEAVKAIEAAIADDHELNEVFIRNLHRILLKEPYEKEAETPDGQRVTRAISVGNYKTAPNNVRTSTGETYYFTPPDQVKSAMGDLIDWYRTREREGENPIIIAATFHYRFVRIHPFDDGNGRMARLLMNMILIKHGYTVSLIRHEDRDNYLNHLERADKSEDLTEFISYIANSCQYALDLHLSIARGEAVENEDDIDKEIVLFKRSFATTTGQIALAREYIASTLLPFYEFCEHKIILLSDVFGGVSTNGNFSITTIGGRKINLHKKLDRPLHLVDYSTIPDHLRSMNFGFSIHFLSFQGIQDHDIGIRIENSVDAHHCLWTFSSYELDFHFEYDERDAGVLKKQFNEILRTMMNELKQRQS